jgi:hypothetical protein
MRKNYRFEEIREQLAEVNNEAILYDGLESALIGYVEQFGRPPIALYDREKCIAALMKDGMTHEDAEEFFGFNTIGGYVGESTPAFATILKKEKK